MSEMTDMIVLLAALVSFGVLMIGWMILPTDAVTDEAAEPTAAPAVRTA
jgi:hypothetical protein